MVNTVCVVEIGLYWVECECECERTNRQSNKSLLTCVISWFYQVVGPDRTSGSAVLLLMAVSHSFETDFR